ncbi:hypothetical protein QTP70_020446, partial [Hemibagrus guttatus]
METPLIWIKNELLVDMMACSRLRSPRLSFLQTLSSLLLSSISMLASNWCSGVQKVPKPLCSPLRRQTCTPSDLFTNGSTQFTWETGDDRFIFPTFHAGIWSCCEENIHKDEWGQRSWGSHKEREMSQFHGSDTSIRESVAWVAFTCCMSAGVSTMNNYTKKVLMFGTKPKSDFYNVTPPYYPPGSTSSSFHSPSMPSSASSPFRTLSILLPSISSRLVPSCPYISTQPQSSCSLSLKVCLSPPFTFLSFSSSLSYSFHCSLHLSLHHCSCFL